MSQITLVRDVNGERLQQRNEGAALFARDLVGLLVRVDSPQIRHHRTHGGRDEPVKALRGVPVGKFLKIALHARLQLLLVKRGL